MLAKEQMDGQHQERYEEVWAGEQDHKKIAGRGEGPYLRTYMLMRMWMEKCTID